MNQPCDDPLFFDALTYVLDEMSSSDRDAFEQRLVDEQDAREAVARAVRFCQRVVRSQAGSSRVTEILPAAPLEKTWRRPAIWGAAAVAIAASVMALVVIENRNGAAPGIASTAKEPGKQLAVAWANVPSPAEALDEGNPGESDTYEADIGGERRLEDADNENEVSGPTEPSPAVDWVLEALTALLSHDSATTTLCEKGASRMIRTTFATACRRAGAEKDAKPMETRVLPFLLQTSLIASLLLVGSARADDESLVGGHDQPNRKEQPNTIKQAARKPAKSNKPGKQANKKAAQKVRQATDAEREEAALAFVREHHPDLVDLVKRLKGTKEKEYRQAIKELSRDSKRIDALRDRDPDRYKLDLRAWQLDSGIRLLAAKLSLEDRPELQEDLKAALAERADVRLAQLKLEHERLTARLKRLDMEIDNFASQREANLKRNFDRLMGTAEKARGRAKSLEKK